MESKISRFRPNSERYAKIHMTLRIVTKSGRLFPTYYDWLSINSHYEEPVHHWLYHRGTHKFSGEAGRRPAGYVIASASLKALEDPRRFMQIELVNQIQMAVKLSLTALFAFSVMFAGCKSDPRVKTTVSTTAPGAAAI